MYKLRNTMHKSKQEASGRESKICSPTVASSPEQRVRPSQQKGRKKGWPLQARGSSGCLQDTAGVHFTQGRRKNGLKSGHCLSDLDELEPSLNIMPFVEGSGTIRGRSNHHFQTDSLPDVVLKLLNHLFYRSH